MNPTSTTVMTTCPTPDQHLQIQLRPQATPIPISCEESSNSMSSHGKHRIRFLHPHYAEPTNVLLDLFAPDALEGGLDYTFAHTACAIIAGNRWEGYFTREVDSDTPLPFRHGDVMALGRYYFQILGSSFLNPYPVVPTFKQWRFPRLDNFPPSWKACLPEPDPSTDRLLADSNFSQALHESNKSCRMSGYVDGTEAAHLCPRSEIGWFQAEQMSEYNSNPNLASPVIADDTANALLLRKDLHHLFDHHRFVFVPKCGELPLPRGDVRSETLASNRVVTHLLVPSDQLSKLYHNIPLREILNVHPAFLLARFALAIFRLFDLFMNAGVTRRVITKAGEKEWLSADQCTTRNRNQSPRKIAKRTANNDEEPGGSGTASVGAVDSESRRAGTKRHRDDEDIGDAQTTPPNAEDTDPGQNTNKRPWTQCHSTRKSPSDSANYLSSTPHKAETHQGEVACTTSPQSSETQQLQDAWIKKERGRSDPKNTWEREAKWVKEVWDGKTMCAEDNERFWDFYGMERRELGNLG